MENVPHLVDLSNESEHAKKLYSFVANFADLKESVRSLETYDCDTAWYNITEREELVGQQHEILLSTKYARNEADAVMSYVTSKVGVGGNHAFVDNEGIMRRNPPGEILRAIRNLERSGGIARRDAAFEKICKVEECISSGNRRKSRYLDAKNEMFHQRSLRTPALIQVLPGCADMLGNILEHLAPADASCLMRTKNYSVEIRAVLANRMHGNP